MGHPGFACCAHIDVEFLFVHDAHAVAYDGAHESVDSQAQSNAVKYFRIVPGLHLVEPETNVFVTVVAP